MRAAFTVVTRNYLWAARALIRQLREHAAATPVYVFVVDLREEDAQLDLDGATVVPAARSMAAESFEAMSFYYDGFELCTAIKPFGHSYLLDREGVEESLYLDSDIYVVGPIWDALEATRGGSVVLSPHILRPAPEGLVEPLETAILKYGVFNGGLFLVRSGDEARRFLDWFAARTRRLCFNGHRGVFVEQLWMNLAPELFEGVAVNRHEGTNVGYWNLHERPMRRTEDGFVEVHGDRLNSLHFSRWDPDRPDIPTADHPAVEGCSIWQELAARYERLIRDCGYDDEAAADYGFGRFSNGRPIEPWMRHHYHELLFSGGWTGGSPFDEFERFSMFARVKGESVRGIVSEKLSQAARWSRR